MEVAKVKELIDNKAKDGVIDLGTANGWKKEDGLIYRFLQTTFKMPNSETTRNISNCYNEYGFDILFDFKIYTVIHRVDSGD
jgi:hypothetical protein